MTLRLFATSLAAMSVLLAVAGVRAADSPDDAAIAAVRKSDEQLVAAFNAGKADEVAGMFLPKGELIDEEGTVYQGPAGDQGSAQCVLQAVSRREAGDQHRVDPPGRTGGDRRRQRAP